MKHFAQVQVPSAALRLLSTAPIVAGVVYGIVRLAELVRDLGI